MGERLPYKQEVAGSNPVLPTRIIAPVTNGGLCIMRPMIVKLQVAHLKETHGCFFPHIKGHEKEEKP